MVGVSPTPVGDVWTLTDLDALPDDGNRYEIVDGLLLVNPPPRIHHQIAAHRLAIVLEGACPLELLVVPGPLRVALGELTGVEPDLSVVRRADVVDNLLAGRPLLVVEVLSPSTRSKDLLLKRDVYQRLGIPSYWIVDPDEPSLLVLELADSVYVEVTRLTGDQTVRLDKPFPIEVSSSGRGG